MNLPDQVFRDPSVKDCDAWRAVIGGKLLPTEWNSRGAALAGMEVERRRLLAKESA